MTLYNPDAKNCWEFLRCPRQIRENCLVFKRNLGRACWTVDYGYGVSIKKDLTKCRDCPWHKKLNPKPSKAAKQLNNNHS